MSYLTNLSLRRRFLATAIVAAAVAAALTVDGVFSSSPASAAQPSVGLGTTTSFAVLAGTTVTNTGPSLISGDLGVSPGTAVTGFPPGTITGGTLHAADAVALQAQSDLTTAYNDAAGRLPATTVSADLGGRSLVSGVYESASSMGLTGTVTLNAQGDPNAVFIFKIGSTLTTASNSGVNLIGGAQACNVFWQVGSSATLGTGTSFFGNILALTSITLDTRSAVTGRVLARNGQVSLDTNKVTRPGCLVVPPSSTPTATATPSASTSPSTSPSTSTTPTASPTSPATTPTSGGPTPSTSTTSTGGTGTGPTASPSTSTTSGRPPVLTVVPSVTASSTNPGRTPTPRRTRTSTPGPNPSGPAPEGPGTPGPIPPGFPQTGAGGAAPSGDGHATALMSGGVVALLGAGAASNQAIRRRKRSPDAR